MKTDNITLGGGCFWCLEAIFQMIHGVMKVQSGYMGGDIKNPTYEDICTGMTNHAEVVHIEFDNKLISLERILKIFWQIHDPTTLNRQGNDIGTQYRSIVFYKNHEEKEIILTSIKKNQKNFNSKIITEIKKEEIFYKAENYHQNYYKNNQNQGYCRYIIKPKLNKFFPL